MRCRGRFRRSGSRFHRCRSRRRFACSLFDLGGCFFSGGCSSGCRFGRLYRCADGLFCHRRRGCCSRCGIRLRCDSLIIRHCPRLGLLLHHLLMLLKAEALTLLFFLAQELVFLLAQHLRNNIRIALQPFGLRQDDTGFLIKLLGYIFEPYL